MASSSEYRYSQCTPGRLLGKGAFGQVFSAKFFNPRKGIHQDIAIKRALLQDSSTLEKEARVLSAFSHCPEIIDCYGYDIASEDKDDFYNLFLEYAPAGDLQDLVELSYIPGGLPDSHVRVYTRTILKALRCLHDRNYVHCDVKPNNILAFPSQTETGHQVKLADFGLAKEPEERIYGQKRGTRQFRCPESLYIGESITPAWDIWSLGCTVVVMATGESVLVGRALVEKTMPKEGRDFVSKCLEEDPKKRWSAKMLLKHPYISPPPSTPRFLLPHQICCAANKNSKSNDSVDPVKDCVWPHQIASGITKI